MKFHFAVPSHRRVLTRKLTKPYGSVLFDREKALPPQEFRRPVVKEEMEVIAAAIGDTPLGGLHFKKLLIVVRLSEAIPV